MIRGLAILLLAAAAATAQPEHLRIGEIEFYGYAGLDVGALRASLPVHEGEQVSESQMEALIGRIEQAAHAVKVNAVCCDDHGGLMIYLAVPGKSLRDVPYRAAPNGPVKLPAAALDLYRRFIDALSQAVTKGAAGEDHSKGYALSEEPGLRAAQVAMHEYATRNERLILRVLDTASDAEQRAVAAELTGYGRRSRKQTVALVRASDDPDETVRNNAARALWVLAGANPQRASRIPAAGFIEMLSSSSWSDRNKASSLLEVLTRSRDRKVLDALRARALASLIEMARWRSAGHAYAARMMLGRCAGIEEVRLEKLAAAGDVQAIVDALPRSE